MPKLEYWKIEDLDDLFEADHGSPAWEQVEEPEMLHQSRWHVAYRYVLRRRTDGTLWTYDYRRAATESQEDDYVSELSPIVLTQVEQFEKTVTIKYYRTVTDE